MGEQQPVRILKGLYAWLAYLTLILAVIGLVWELIRPRFRNRALAFAVMAIFAGLLARVAFVGLIDALSYTAARNEQYAIPAADLLVAFCALGCSMFGAHVVDLYRSVHRQDAPSSDPGAADLMSRE
jgi:hypothetical protein